jgi:hypothetical protein
MEKDAKKFLDITSKKLAKIEKKIQEMKLNIVIMSFYSDIKLIEDKLLSYQADGFEVDNTLLEKVEAFKLLLQQDKNLPKLGKKFIELTEEFYKLRKKLYRNSKEKLESSRVAETTKKSTKELPEDYLSVYV